MVKRKIGIVMFLLGTIGILFNLVFTWIGNPIYRVNSPEALVGTIWATTGGFLFMFNGMFLIIGIGFSIIGVLVYSAKKGSFFWLWGLLPFAAYPLLYFWQPVNYYPPLFGVGGGLVTLSYLAVLWFWIKKNTGYEGAAKLGMHIQLLGYSFLYITSLFVCIYLGQPHLPGMADLPLVSAESVLIAFSIGWVLLAIGRYLPGKQHN